MDLGALADDQGSFPLAPGPYRPEAHSRDTCAGIRSLIGIGSLVGPLAHSVLYLRYTVTRLFLKTFRGEPAISRFDWPFTPTHSSSVHFSTCVGSVFHALLHALHPGHA